MTSGKQARRQRQQAARPPVRSTEGRRASPKVLGIALATVTGSTLPDSDVIAQQLGGIPQQGNVLGKASAPVTMVEYIDLQCPVCRQFETEVMPTLIQRYVRPGKVKVEVRPIAFIGPDSERGRRAMIAAEPEGKAFNFSQILYFNQGAENSGWLDDSMIANAAVSVGLDPQTILKNKDSKAVDARATTYDQSSRSDGVSGTPTIGIAKSGGKPTYFPAGDPGLSPVSAALDKALEGS
jgi:protein-disulfide isomerase